jgi:regulator of sigma E protease
VIVIDVLWFIFVLGLLVFFHELGHFVAAKACGIYVDRFSLGMPPRIFGVRWGETDYCVGALPIGGYVKMAGQEDVPTSEGEQESEFAHVPKDRWFNSKPVWQRLIVIIAGPLMNVVLALVLYGLIVIVGSNVPASDLDNRVGRVEMNAPAATAQLYRVPEGGAAPDFQKEPDAVGWRTGDHIVSIDGDEIQNMQDVLFKAILGGGNPREVVIDRPNDQGSGLERYISHVVPVKLEGGLPYRRFGTTPYLIAQISDVQPGSPAEAAGLKNGDVIEKANGQIIDKITLVTMISKIKPGEELDLGVRRGGELVSLRFRPRQIGRIMSLETEPTLATPFGDAANELPAPDAPLTIVQVSKEFNEATGVKDGDRITEVEGQPATVELLRKLQTERIGGEIAVKILRPAVLFGLARKSEVFDAKLTVEPIGQIGVSFSEPMVFHKLPARRAVGEAIRLCRLDLERTVLMLSSLFSGEVSAKELGGPILIYQITTSAAQEGFATLLKRTAFISVNLCIINLLPIPVADGGHIVFLMLEAVRRKPLDIRIMERIQQAGLVLLLLIFLFVTFNDINRLLFGWIQ